MADTVRDGLMPAPETLERIRAEIDAYNAQRARVLRQTRLRLALGLGGWTLLSLGLCWPPVAAGHSQAFGLACVALLFGGYFVFDRAMAPRRRLRQSVRDRLLPVVFGFVDDLRYSVGGVPRFLDRMPGDEFLRRNHSSHRDQISGRLDGFAFTLGETEFSVGHGGKREITFIGIAIAFVQEAGFPGTLLAAKRPGRLARAIRGLFEDGRLGAMKSGDDRIDASHEFRTDNPEAALPRVAAMAGALDRLAGLWPDGVIRIALRHKDGFLLVPTGKDFFELPPLGTPLDVEAHVRPMIDDLLALVSTARLVSRI